MYESSLRIPIYFLFFGGRDGGRRDGRRDRRKKKEGAEKKRLPIKPRPHRWAPRKTDHTAPRRTDHTARVHAWPYYGAEKSKKMGIGSEKFGTFYIIILSGSGTTVEYQAQPGKFYPQRHYLFQLQKRGNVEHCAKKRKGEGGGGGGANPTRIGEPAFQ